MPKAACVYVPELLASTSHRPHRRSSNHEPSSPANEEGPPAAGPTDNESQARHGGGAKLQSRSCALAFQTLNSAAVAAPCWMRGQVWDPFTQVINTHFHGCINFNLRWHQAECESFTHAFVIIDH